jgi:hypothetical protein
MVVHLVEALPFELVQRTIAMLLSCVIAALIFSTIC